MSITAAPLSLLNDLGTVLRKKQAEEGGVKKSSEHGLLLTIPLRLKSSSDMAEVESNLHLLDPSEVILSLH